MFTPAGNGLKCEIHLLVNSRYHMFATDYGYCGKKARWWYDGILLCQDHKNAVQNLLAAMEAK